MFFLLLSFSKKKNHSACTNVSFKYSFFHHYLPLNTSSCYYILNLCYASIALAPSAWDKAPSLDTYQSVFVNPTLKDKIHVTDIGKILQAENAKMSENQTHEKRSTTENIEHEVKIIVMKPINEIASAMKNNVSDSSEENANATIIPRNVILLLIDERDQDEKREENSWKGYKERLPFAIEGFLQVLLHDRINYFYG